MPTTDDSLSEFPPTTASCTCVSLFCDGTKEYHDAWARTLADKAPRLLALSCRTQNEQRRVRCYREARACTMALRSHFRKASAGTRASVLPVLEELHQEFPPAYDWLQAD